MADDDDLDAFFDEVSEVEAQAVKEEESQADTGATKDDEVAEPPTKKVKTAAHARPRGVVVAASTSVVIPAKERQEKEAQLEAAAAAAAASPSAHSSTNPHSNRVGPSATSLGPPRNPSASINSPQQQQQQLQSQKKGKSAVRMAAGQKWVDETLDEWPENDFRIFVGNLSNEVSDQMLFEHFQKYPSLAKARVVRDSRNPDKSKGYGFVSLLDPLECARALREMDQTWLSSRPIRIKRSDWKDRDFKVVKKREKKEKKKRFR